MGFNNFILKKKNTEARWFSRPPPPPTTTTTSSPPPLSLWSYWPSSKNPKKVVFHADKYDNDYNSDSWFTSSSEDEFEGHSCMTTSSDDERIEMEVNTIYPQVKNSFEPSMSGDNVLGESEAENEVPFEEGMVIVKEPEDAYMDFKISMAEMVVARGLQSMEALQELLEWYLKANGEDRHDVIVEAFVDLVLELSPTPSPSS